MILAKIRKFLRLTTTEKKFFLEAFLVLGLMRAAILMIPFKRLTRSLQQLPKVGEMERLSPDDLVVVDAVSVGIKLAVSQTLWESACLVQAFTVRRMMQKRGVSGVFYLGVKKNDAGDMDAHAWSQCGDVVLTGGAGAETFAIISVFAWEGK